MIPNLGYQGTRDFNPQMGQQVQKKSKSASWWITAKGDRDDEESVQSEAKRLTFSYKHPYLEWYDLVALPTNYRLPEFAKFTGQDIEHVSRYLTQLGKASVEEAHRVRFFSLSLSGSAFTWFSSLPVNSIANWADLEKKFYTYFYTRIGEKKITNLTTTR